MREQSERDALLRARASQGPPHDHFVQFYDDPARLARAVADFLAAALRRRGAAIVLAVPENAEAIRHELTLLGHDVDRLARSGRYVVIDAHAVLRDVIVDGVPSEQRFQQVIGSVLERLVAEAHPARVHAFGELVDVLWAAGGVEAAGRLEEIWNGLIRRLDFALFCAYSARHFTTAEERDGFDTVCRQHGRVLPVDRDLLRAL